MKQFFINHIRFFVLLIVALFYWRRNLDIFSNTKPALGFYTVTRGNIISFLDIPGTVSSGNSVGLSFQESGKIAAVNVKEGQIITEGQPLASLDNSARQTALSEAQAL